MRLRQKAVESGCGPFPERFDCTILIPKALKTTKLSEKYLECIIFPFAAFLVAQWSIANRLDETVLQDPLP